MANHYLNSPISLSVEKKHVGQVISREQSGTQITGILSQRNNNKYETLPRVSQTITKNPIGLPQITSMHNHTEFLKKLNESQQKKKWMKGAVGGQEHQRTSASKR